MLKRILELLFVVSLIVWARLTPDTNLQAELYGMVIGGIGVLGIEGIDFLYKERHFLRLRLACFRPFPPKEIRLTLAYLYRIEVNGKYLLVKSNRLANTYQPVGGVYKYYNPEALTDLISMGAMTCNKVQNDADTENDLRLILAKRRNLPKFLKWFFRGDKREVDPWREFFEELVAPGIIPADIFGYINYDLVGQHFEQIHWDAAYSVHTFKYVDIYVPKFLNVAQIQTISNLAQRSSDEFLWATRQEILQGRTANNKFIAEHTHKIFHNKKLN